MEQTRKDLLESATMSFSRLMGHPNTSAIMTSRHDRVLRHLNKLFGEGITHIISQYDVDFVKDLNVATSSVTSHDSRHAGSLYNSLHLTKFLDEWLPPTDALYHDESPCPTIFRQRTVIWIDQINCNIRSLVDRSFWWQPLDNAYLTAALKPLGDLIRDWHSMKLHYTLGMLQPYVHQLSVAAADEATNAPDPSTVEEPTIPPPGND